MPSACAVSTTVSPGAAIASGRTVSAAGALTREPERRSKASVALFGNSMAHFPNLSSLRGTTCPPLVQRAKAQGRSNPELWCPWSGLLRGACHRARIRATRWLAMTAWTIFPSFLCRHRLGQVFRDLVEKAGGRQPALVGADQ